MNFGFITKADCVNVLPPVDSRCSDPAFALANPTICPPQQLLVIKPGVALTCQLGSVQFKAFTQKAGVEVDVTGSGAVFTSSDLNVVLVGASSGNATALAQGEVVITATYQGLVAHATFTVLAGTDCCSQMHVATMVVVDDSRSMSQVFGGSYPSRLAYAKAAASNFISGLNEQKDSIGLISFDAAQVDMLNAPTGTAAPVLANVPGISQSLQKTSFYDALNLAIGQLQLAGADRQVIFLISDGEDTVNASYTAANNPFDLISSFKNNGGIVICLGCRASGKGFAFLSNLATGGFFINAYPATAQQGLDYTSGLKGYICSGNCTPNGDVIVATGQLDYDKFSQWNVVGGTVDLLGNGFFDFLPGNGLYVDLSGTTAPQQGRLELKTPLSLTAGHVYRVTLNLAGNQRESDTPYAATVKVIAGPSTLLNQSIVINDLAQDFHLYSFSFTAPSDASAIITIQQTSIPVGGNPVVGLLLDNVECDDVTTGTILLTDNFNSENEQYVPPKCGQGSLYVYIPSQGFYGYEVGYNCYGEGCLDSPPGVQLPDPNPLPDIESGSAPPKIYNSTKSFCASCVSGFINLNPTAFQPDSVSDSGGGSSSSLIPVMTSATTPSGVVTASTTEPNPLYAPFHAFGPLISDGLAWRGLSVTLPQWIAYQFPAPVPAKRWGVIQTWFRGWTNPSGGYPDFQIILQGSNDGTNWTDIDGPRTISAVSDGSDTFGPWSLWYVFTIANPGPYLYYRWYLPLNTFAPFNGALQMARAVLIGDIVSPLPFWTKSQFNTAKPIAYYTVQGPSDTSASPKDWVLEGSTDNTNWTTLDTQTNLSWYANEAKSFLVSNSSTWNYFRLTITANNGNVNGVQIQSFAVFGPVPAQVCADGTAQSTVSQTDADAKALDAATTAAQSQLNCRKVYTSTEQFTATCPVGSVPNSATRSATATSLNNATEADAAANAAAQAAAQAALNCSGSTNNQPITIVDALNPNVGLAIPYPSVLSVTGKTGHITNVSLKLNKFTHSWPSDVRVLLRSPAGTLVLVMGPAGGSTAVNDVDLVFDDAGATTVPTPIVSGTYQPTGGLPQTDYPQLPVHPYGTALADFNGEDPNGQWSLWVIDVVTLNSGQITGNPSWDLVITSV